METQYFLMGVMIVLIPFIFGIISSSTPKKKASCGYEISIRPVPPTVDKSIFNESKSLLVDMGFSATEAKQMLNSVGNHYDADEWVRQCLTKIRV